MKDSLYTLLFLCLVATAIMQNLLLLALVFSLLFTWWFGAFWLVPLAILIDGHFGAFGAMPLYSVLALLWFMVSELLRPVVRIIK
jgi:hypothetical protein